MTRPSLVVLKPIWVGACVLALSSGCKQQLPAPMVPPSAEEVDEAGEGEVKEMELGEIAVRITPNWLPAPVSETTPRLGEGARLLTPRLRVIPRAEEAQEREQAAEPGPDEQDYQIDPVDEVIAELVSVDAGGEKLLFAATFNLDTESCDPEVELNAIEGVEVAGHYMFQVTCYGGGDSTFVDSFTMLVRVDSATPKVELLWEGEGWSESERDACLSYDVVGFLVDTGGKKLLAVRDREVVRTIEEADSPEVSCNEYPFEQVAAAEIDLLAETGAGVEEFEVPEFDPAAVVAAEAEADAEVDAETEPGDEN